MVSGSVGMSGFRVGGRFIMFKVVRVVVVGMICIVLKVMLRWWVMRRIVFCVMGKGLVSRWVCYVLGLLLLLG